MVQTSLLRSSATHGVFDVTTQQRVIAQQRCDVQTFLLLNVAFAKEDVTAKDGIGEGLR